MTETSIDYRPEQWSGSGAVVAPMTWHGKIPEYRKTAFDGGVYDANLNPVHEAKYIGASGVNVTGPPRLDGLRKMPGTSLYAGFLRGHFGNFLMDSVGRFWPSAGTKIDRVIYSNFEPLRQDETAPRLDRIEQQGKRSFVRSFVSIFVGDVPIEVVGRPIECERLIVGRALMTNSGASHIAGHPEFRRHVTRCIDRLSQDVVRNACDLYVSRSALPLSLSAFLHEERLDRHFASEGYRIIHPQNMSVEDQFRTYRSARRIVIGEGSALHMYVLASEPYHQLAIITRRSPLPLKFSAQALGWGIENLTTVDAVAGYLLPADRSTWTSSTLNNAPTDLDFARLSSDLRASGFIAKDISRPSSEEQLAEIKRISCARDSAHDVPQLHYVARNDALRKRPR